MSLIVPAFVFVIAAAMAVTAGVRMAPPIATSAWLMPLIISVAMALVALAIVAGDIAQRRTAVRAGPGDPAEEPRSTPAQVAGWLALSAGYAVATPLLGFEVATVIFLLLALKVFGRASWLVTVAVAAAIVVLVPLIFRSVFLTLVP